MKVLHKLLQTSFPLDGTYAATRFSCIQNLFLCYEEMDHWVDGGLSKARLARFGKRHLLLYCEMHSLQGEYNSLMWSLCPKHHLFAHLVSEADSNPKLSWNYCMESEIGNACPLAASCSKQHLHKVLLRRHALTQ